ncbi:MAG: S-adenosylmethionine decarboxylase [Candidatus Nomurabacteria bacterium]|nr:S-adenosylmethionine decarboxylase [Candidatus Nomurabacteria bacterium]USN87915.1 MAG: S-adenosylmethionine decarboxylase [Candidatus Nomurabacteria bacterium]
MENKTNVEQFGIHLMLDGYGADLSKLKDKESLLDMLKNIPVAMGMHAISNPLVVEVGPKNRKDPGGLSGFVLIAESHLSFHTFPNRGFVTIDLYTCQNELDSDKLISELVTAFCIKDYEFFIQKRGTKYPVNNIY